MNTSSKLALILLAWLFMPTLSERIANALPALTAETLYLVAAGACAIALVITESKGH